VRRSLAALITAAVGKLRRARVLPHITGSLHLIERLTHDKTVGQACTGIGGYDDIHAGTSVVVRDDASKIVATGSLAAGKVVDRLSLVGTCGFDFEVDVPDSAFCQVEVSHRGNVTFSKGDLEGRSWTVALSLG